MSVRVTVLVDNQVRGHKGLAGEHGLGMLVETEAGKILFDTGQTGLFLANAAQLNIELTGVDKVVLSHGHYDHGGGLLPLIDKYGPFEVSAHPDAFTQKYSRRPDKPDRYIGLPYDATALAHRGVGLNLDANPQEVIPGVLATGIIPREVDFEQLNSGFFIKKGRHWRPDQLYDDQALLVATKEGLVVLLGCAHSGVINTLNYAVKLTGASRILAVIGGFHLDAAPSEKIAKTISALQKMKPEMIIPCHCSGFSAKVRLFSAFGECFADGGVGTSFTF